MLPQAPKDIVTQVVIDGMSEHNARGLPIVFGNVMKQYFVYILLCSDNSYYVGITNDMDRRFAEHQSGEDPGSYTFKR